MARNGPDLVAGRRDDADRGREDEQGHPVGQREGDPRHRHEDRAHDQHAPPPKTVGVGRQPERQDGVADEREAEHDADRPGVEAERIQVEDERHGQEAVAEHPQGPQREEGATVAIQSAQAGHEPGIDGLGRCVGWHRPESTGSSASRAVCDNRSRRSPIEQARARRRRPGHDGAVAHHATDDHGDDHGHDDHAHDERPLGPLDVPAWGAGVAGILLGLAVAIAFMLATGPIPTA